MAVGPLWASVFSDDFPRAQWASWAGGLLLVVIGVCAYTDLRWHRIFNWATYSAFLWGLLINLALDVSHWIGQPIQPLGHPGNPPWLNLGAIGLGRSLIAGLITFLLMFILYRISGGGAGDVKIATAIAVYLGLERSFSMLVYSYLAAGLYGLSLILWKLGPVASIGYVIRKFGSNLLPGRIAPPSEFDKTLLMSRIPLGGFFAIGTLAVLAEDLPWFTNAIDGTDYDVPA